MLCLLQMVTLIAKAAHKALQENYTIDLQLTNPPFGRDAQMYPLQQTLPSHLPLHAGAILLRGPKVARAVARSQQLAELVATHVFGTRRNAGIEMLRLAQRRLDALAGIAPPVVNKSESAAVPVTPVEDLRRRSRLWRR